MALPDPKTPRLIWAMNIWKTKNMTIDTDQAFAIQFPEESVLMFGVAEESAPILFQSFINALFYLTDYYDISYHDAAMAIKPAAAVCDIESPEYIAMPTPMAITCPACDQTITQRDLSDGKLICPHCKHRIDL